MFSKIIKWIKNPARYMWIKDPLKLTIAVGIIAVISVTAFYTFHGLKADEISSEPPVIKLFQTPNQGGYDYLINVQVDNVANIIPGIDHSTYPNNKKAACIITNGRDDYSLFATTNNGTSIPKTTIHRQDFTVGSNLKHGFVYDNEALTITCVNRLSSDHQSAFIENIKGKTSLGYPLIYLKSDDEAKTNEPISVQWNTNRDWEVCFTNFDAAMKDQFAVSSNDMYYPEVTDSTIIPLYCRNKSNNYFNYVGGRFVFVRPPGNKWKLNFTAPKEVKPNTDFQVQYTLYDSAGSTRKVGTTCFKSGGWNGETLDGSNTETISGWVSGSKTFSLICVNSETVGPVFQTVTVVDRNLKFSVDGKDVPENANNYQPPNNSGVNVAWQYQGPATDTCVAKSINVATGQAVGNFNGPMAFSGQMYNQPTSSTINYSITCATEKKTINVLPPPSTPPPPSSQLNLNINPTDYSSVSSSGLYQLKTNQFTPSWNLTPAVTGTPCTGSGDIATWNIKRASSGSQLLTNISGTKKITLLCGLISKSLSVNYTPAIVDSFTFKVMGRSYKDFPNEYVTKGTTATIEWSYTGTSSNCTLWTKNKDNPSTTLSLFGTKSTVAKSGNISYIFNYDTETRTLQCGMSQGAVNITGTSAAKYSF